MKRKHFIASVIASAATIKVMGMRVTEPAYYLPNALKMPPYLKEGDKIGITSPAGYINLEEIDAAVKKIEEWGFEVKVGETIGKRDHTFGGTDEERRWDLQSMLDDPDLGAIMCARGGYGLVRILDRLNFKKFVADPKWMIGFSDITALHSHIHTNFNVASIHSKMCNSFPADWSLAEPIQRDTIQSIWQCLKGEKMRYSVMPNVANRGGNGTGQLVGGNLKSLESLTGSISDLNTKGKILFVEDTGEYLYSVDRMFWNLKRSGKLSGLRGLIIGGFKMKKDDAGEEFGLTLEQIVTEKIKEYNYPVCFDFPVGHQRNNYALKCGAVHTLSVSPQNVLLQEK